MLQVGIMIIRNGLNKFNKFSSYELFVYLPRLRQHLKSMKSIKSLNFEIFNNNQFTRFKLHFSENNIFSSIYYI